MASSKGLLTFKVFHIGDLFQKQQRIAKAQLGFTVSPVPGLMHKAWSQILFLRFFMKIYIVFVIIGRNFLHRYMGGHESSMSSNFIYDNYTVKY